MSNKKKPKVRHHALAQAKAETAAAPDDAAAAAPRKVEVEYDGVTWTIDAESVAAPEMLYLLAEMQAMVDDADTATEADAQEALMMAMRVIRLLFGRQQGQRFVRGCADVEAIGERLIQFFALASTKAGGPDPTGGSSSSADTSQPSKPTSEPATA